jgi:hypothetical protein
MSGDRGDQAWESLGTIAGLGTCSAIAVQAVAAWRGPAPVLSDFFLLAMLLVFAFWCAYGWRFRRPAIWLTNGLALLLQAALCAACWCVAN